jgi:hypothetical protein
MVKLRKFLNIRTLKLIKTQSPPTMQLKVLLASILLTSVPNMLTAANSSFARELAQLTKQRDKDVGTATKRIDDRYLELIEQVMNKAAKAGDIDTAAKIKTILDVGRGAVTPARVVGNWDWKSATGRSGTWTIKDDGTANGIVANCEWQIRGTKLVITSPDKRVQFTYQFDGETMRGGNSGYKHVLTRRP